MKKSIIITSILIIIVLVGALGYYLGYSHGSKAVVSSYATKVAEVNNLFPLSNVELFDLTGSVKKVNGNVVTINAIPVAQNPFMEKDFPLIRNVTVADSTIITLSQQKDSATYEKETANFQKTTQASIKSGSIPVGASIIPPASFKETQIKVSDIKVGDTLNVTAASNIASTSSFLATKIEVKHMNIPITSITPASTTTKK